MIRDHATDGTRLYETICIVALGAQFVLLLERGFGSLTLLPLIIGAAGLLGRGRWHGQPLVLWRIAPPVLVIAIAVPLLLPTVSQLLNLPKALDIPVREAIGLQDLLLAVAVLAYIAAHYRLQGLEATPLPADPRQTGRTEASQRPLPASEMFSLALELLLWPVLALLAWDLLPRWYDLGLDPTIWRTLLILWLIGMGALLASSILNYLGRRRMTRAEAELMLQDILWRETRREQRRIGRWSAWKNKNRDPLT